MILKPISRLARAIVPISLAFHRASLHYHCYRPTSHNMCWELYWRRMLHKAPHRLASPSPHITKHQPFGRMCKNDQAKDIKEILKRHLNKYKLILLSANASSGVIIYSSLGEFWLPLVSMVSGNDDSKKIVCVCDREIKKYEIESQDHNAFDHHFRLVPRRHLISNIFHIFGVIDE